MGEVDEGSGWVEWTKEVNVWSGRREWMCGVDKGSEWVERMKEVDVRSG